MVENTRHSSDSRLKTGTYSSVKLSQETQGSNKKKRLDSIHGSSMISEYNESDDSSQKAGEIMQLLQQ